MRNKETPNLATKDPPVQKELQKNESDFHKPDYESRSADLLKEPDRSKKKVTEPQKPEKWDFLGEIEQEKLPIKRGEIFDPKKELQEIRYLPKTQRKGALEVFKKKLAFQQERLGSLQEQIIDIMRKNPDASMETIYNVALDIGSNFGMSEDQKKLTHSIIKTYTEKHQKIREVRREFTDDRELFRALFGRLPMGKLEVIEGPITLYFRLQNIKDYAFLRSNAFLQNRNPEPKEIRSAQMSGGVALRETLVPGLDWVAIVEKSSSSISGRDFKPKKPIERVYWHEEQHAIKRLFATQRRWQATWVSLENAKNDQERQEALKNHLRIRRLQAEEYARDEILAYFKIGELKYTYENLLEEGGLYNYFTDDEEDLKTRLKKVLAGYPQSLIDGLVKKVWVDEYRQTLKDAINSLEELENIGYSKDQAISVLIHEPLGRWKKVINRLLKKYHQ